MENKAAKQEVKPEKAAKQEMVVKLAVKIIPMFQLLQKEPSLVVLQKVSQIPMRHQDFSQLQATRL